MADAVSSLTVFGGTRKRVVRLTNISDGTGESGVVKVDRSALTGPSGGIPTHIIVERIEYDVGGMQVRLYWDEDGGDEEITILSGAGYLDWREAGGLKKPSAPELAGDGDIILTTNAHTAGDGYTITLWLRLKD